MATNTPALPSRYLLENQTTWLAPARSRLLRQASIARRRSVLDLGAGRGLVTPELARRSGGRVYALDLSPEALYETDALPTTLRIAGDAGHLPFVSSSIELIFSQFTLMWVKRLERAIDELWRVLQSGGVFCAIEPDYLGMIEYPESVAISEVWRTALTRSGAMCDVGRRLPGLLESRGFNVQVRLLDQLTPPSRLRFTMLQELPLEPEEAATVAAAQQSARTLNGWQQLAHLPLFLVIASRPG